jgi:hypothetical protein
MIMGFGIERGSKARPEGKDVRKSEKEGIKTRRPRRRRPIKGGRLE